MSTITALVEIHFIDPESGACTLYRRHLVQGRRVNEAINVLLNQAAGGELLPFDERPLGERCDGRHPA